MIAEPEYYVPLLDIILASANLCMSNWSVGLARAAFEESLDLYQTAGPGRESA